MYGKGDLLRLRGCFVQCVLFWVSRSGSLHVSPTLFVLGANPCDPTIHQTVGLEIQDPRRWTFNQMSLDNEFAAHIVDQMERDSRLSFIAQLKDDNIDHALRHHAVRSEHWAASIFLAFYNLTRGAEKAQSDISQARRTFERLSNASIGKRLRDWEQALSDRLQMLGERASQPDCTSRCRSEADEHAVRLRLAPIAWPPEWMEAGASSWRVC
jgi:hypothetical protein